MEKTIHELVRRLETDYISGATTISKYVEFDQYENINKIEAYLNSKHTTGATDSMDRDKPFFNIVTAACNIWFRATDIDRKNIRIKATKASHYLLAFLGTILLQEWMRKESFGSFLNEWGRVLARYGSAVTKFIDKGSKLHAEVIPWSRLIVDVVDFDANPVIEKLYFTPAQLKKKKEYDQEYVDELIKTATSVRRNPDRQAKDTRDEYIEVYEVHGELPLSYLTDNEDDEEEYVQQMHVVSFVMKKENAEQYHEFTLYAGKEAKSPYLITHLIKEDGRTQSIGAVEHLFEAQWMVNHSVKAIKDQLDLASKLIFQTSDGNFVGQNALNAIETGDILIHQINQPLTELNNTAHDITALQNYGMQWQLLAKEITSTPEALRGETMPSGTAFRQVALLNREAHSLFEIMTENKGLYLEQMLQEYVIPHLKKKMDTSEEISAILDEYQIKQIDSLYVPNEAVRRANNKIKNTVLSGQIYDPSLQETDIQNEQALIQKSLSNLGNQRFIKPSEISSKTWKDVLKDLEWEIEIEITGEQTDKQATLETLSTVFQTLANPNTAMVLQTPEGKLVFNKILEEAGRISPVELAQMPKAQPMPVQPMAQVGGAPLTNQNAF